MNVRDNFLYFYLMMINNKWPFVHNVPYVFTAASSPGHMINAL